MSYAWYKIFNLTEFEATNLVSRTYTLNLEAVGQKDILVTKSIHVSITYEGVFLPIQLSDKNPYEIDDHAVWIDEDTQDVYLGVPVE